MLRSFGASAVAHATRPEDALRAIRGAALPFDIIICDFNFSARGKLQMNGQDLLDELRQSRGLPMRTAFIMVTDEARYQNVTESVEGALDDYLLKPLSASRFESRLSVVLERKTALAQVFQQIESEQFEDAAKTCEKLFEQGGKHRLYAARIGSELWLRLRQFDAAQRMFEAVIEAKAVPWAKLGLAQVQLETQGARQASRALETLLTENPSFADAYDVLGRSQVEDGLLDQACDTYAKAVELTPANVRRLQKLGALAFLLGKGDMAKSSLDAAVNMGQSTRSFDYQTLLLQALAHYDADASYGWERGKRLLEEAVQKAPDSYRIQSLLRMVGVVEALEKNRLFEAVEQLKAQARDALRPEFDFEMAVNVLHLLARVLEKETRLDDATAWVKTITERFSVSKASQHFIELALSRQTPLKETSAAALQRVNEASRGALGHVVSKQYDQAASQLLMLAEQTLNARVFAMTSSFLERHGANVSSELAMQAQLSLLDLQENYAAYGTHARIDLRTRATSGAAGSKPV